MDQPTAVDVERLEDADDGFAFDAVGDGPMDDAEVLVALLETVQNRVEEFGFVLESAFEEAEIATVKLDPEATALEMFHPFGS